MAVPASMILHAAAAIAIAIVPLLLADALPEPDGGMRAFFVEPIAAPPPPPPPPPPAARAAAATRVAPKAPRPRPAGFVAPIEVPTEIKPEEGLDLGGIEGGVAGGVEGGVPGGVVGGVVGGLPDAPPPPAGEGRARGRRRPRAAQGAWTSRRSTPSSRSRRTSRAS